MKEYIENLAQDILNGKEILLDEAIKIIQIDENEFETLKVLFQAANLVREKYAGNQADLCTILNAKSGRCTEDCKYCAQSVHYETGISEYELLSYDEILKRALEVEGYGAHRFSLVTSGKGIACDKELEKLLSIYSRLKQDTNLKLCASHGIISYDQLVKLKEAGVDRYHHNVETSKSYYSHICTTHEYEDRISTIKNSIKAGLGVCCGGIIGVGEAPLDRVQMAYEIKALGITSIPINVLMPIRGTPYEHNKMVSPLEILKTMAVFRLIIPHAYIRYAGGRMALEDMQGLGFMAGVNAALVGNYLTTIGSNVDEDKQMMVSAGLKI